MGTKVRLKDERVVDITELGGLADVAETHGWNPSTLTTWADRYANTPKPVHMLKRGALYVMSDWDDWRPGSAQE